MPITFTRGDVIAQTTLTPTTKPREQIEELIEQAKLADPKLHAFMRELSNNIKNESGRPIQYIRAPIKTRQRIAEKCGIRDWNTPANDQPSDKDPLLVKDISRGTIVYTTIAQMLAFRDYIYNRPEFVAIRDKQSPAVKDLWSKGVTDEYKDIKFFLQVMITYKGARIPHIVELQLNVGQMARGKVYGHAFYNLSRLAMVGGRQSFEPANENCQIVVPGEIKGKLGTKLRSALGYCHSAAQGNAEVMLAIGILRKMLHNKLKTVADLKLDAPVGMDTSAAATQARLRELNKDADGTNFANGTAPLTIQCGPYDPVAAGQQDSGPAQAWAIARLSSFVWSSFTSFQNKPGATGENVYDKMRR